MTHLNEQMRIRLLRTVMIVTILCLGFLLTGCDSENVKKARDAYENGDYVTVIECLENESDLDNETEEMLAIARANVAFENGEYNEVVTELSVTESGKDTEIYKKSVKTIVKDAIQTGETKYLQKAIETDNQIGGYATNKITKACDEYNYNAFKVLESLKESLQDGDVKEQLTKYYDANKLNKVKAFLVGKWEWQHGDKVNTVVKNIIYKDNLMATVVTVGDNEKEYQILVDDVYWKDFEILDEKSFTCLNLCKTRDAIASECETVGRINYEDDSLHLHVTAPPPYRMVDPDRDWKRVEN